jgi:hypothetical protein
LNQLEKFVNELLQRVNTLPSSPNDDSVPALTLEQYDAIMESIFVELRGARAKKTDAFGNKTYADVWDDISDFELDYFKEKWFRISPEQRYQYFKQRWSSHDSTYCSRGLYMYDGEGCTADGCVKGCRYFSEEGRIEDSEVESWYKDYRKTRGEENRKRREAAGCHVIHYKIFPPRIEDKGKENHT